MKGVASLLPPWTIQMRPSWSTTNKRASPGGEATKTGACEPGRDLDYGEVGHPRRRDDRGEAKCPGDETGHLVAQDLIEGAEFPAPAPGGDAGLGDGLDGTGEEQAIGNV